MNGELEALQKVLEMSVKKNGKDYPLTLGHLLHLVRATRRHLDREQERSELEGLACEYKALYG